MLPISTNATTLKLRLTVYEMYRLSTPTHGAVMKGTPMHPHASMNFGIPIISSMVSDTRAMFAT